MALKGQKSTRNQNNEIKKAQLTKVSNGNGTTQKTSTAQSGYVLEIEDNNFYDQRCKKLNGKNISNNECFTFLVSHFCRQKKIKKNAISSCMKNCVAFRSMSNTIPFHLFIIGNIVDACLAWHDFSFRPAFELCLENGFCKFNWVFQCLTKFCHMNLSVVFKYFHVFWMQTSCWRCYNKCIPTLWTIFFPMWYLYAFVSHFIFQFIANAKMENLIRLFDIWII